MVESLRLVLLAYGEVLRFILLVNGRGVTVGIIGSYVITIDKRGVYIFTAALAVCTGSNCINFIFIIQGKFMVYFS